MIYTTHTPACNAKIRKEIKKTMKKNINNYILAAFAVALVFLCVRSIYAPMDFDSARKVRERDVKLCLVKIRQAEEAYMRLTGTYSGSFDSLVACGLLPDSLRFVPGSGGKTFRLKTAAIATASGKHVQVMECSAAYDEYLSGLGGQYISALIEEAETAGLFPGLKIGDIERNNDNAGNWE